MKNIIVSTAAVIALALAITAATVVSDTPVETIGDAAVEAVADQVGATVGAPEGDAHAWGYYATSSQVRVGWGYCYVSNWAGFWSIPWSWQSCRIARNGTYHLVAVHSEGGPYPDYHIHVCKNYCGHIVD